MAFEPDEKYYYFISRKMNSKLHKALFAEHKRHRLIFVRSDLRQLFHFLFKLKFDLVLFYAREIIESLDFWDV
jgi:hypothetical protein